MANETDSATFSGSGTSVSCSTSGLTINTDDVVVAFVHGNGTGYTITSDSGFTERMSEVNGGGTNRLAIYDLVHSGSVPSTYDWTLGSSQAWSVIIRVFDNVDTASIWDVAPQDANSASGSSGTNANCPDITTSNADSLGIAALFIDSNSRTLDSVGNSFGTIVTLSAGRSQGSAIKALGAAGAVGTTNMNWTSSDDYYVVQMALNDAGGAFTLTADSGSYTYTGTAAELDLAALLGADSGTYTYTGTAADLNRGFYLEGASGAYVYSGTDAALTFAGAGNFTLNAETGNYTYSGTDAELDADLILSADTGTYVYTGTAAELNRGYPLSADSGSYVYSGTDADLSKTQVLSADSGTYIYAGTSATISSSGQIWTIQPDDTSLWAVQSNDSSIWTVQ